MHVLVSHSGCTGTSKTESDIEETLRVAFGGILKTLSGWKYPQNVRGFRMLVEELLHPAFAKHHLKCMSHLLQALDDTE